MLIIKEKLNQNYVIKVGNKVHNSDTKSFHHLNHMINGEEPINKKAIVKKGRKIGTAFTYKVKGVAPKYGYSIKDTIPRRMKSKLYKMFENGKSS